jgi:hypothetical protein
MADGYDVEMTNLAAFSAAMAAIRRDVAEPKDGLNAAAAQAISDAQAAAPRLSGRLAGAHRALPAAGARVRLVVDTPYAAVIHWGWPGHGIRRQPWLVATWMRQRAPLDRMARALQSDIDKAAAKT